MTERGLPVGGAGADSEGDRRDGRHRGRDRDRPRRLGAVGRRGLVAPRTEQPSSPTATSSTRPAGTGSCCASSATGTKGRSRSSTDRGAGAAAVCQAELAPPLPDEAVACLGEYRSYNPFWHVRRRSPAPASGGRSLHLGHGGAPRAAGGRALQRRPAVRRQPRRFRHTTRRPVHPARARSSALLQVRPAMSRHAAPSTSKRGKKMRRILLAVALLATLFALCFASAAGASPRRRHRRRTSSSTA